MHSRPYSAPRPVAYKELKVRTVHRSQQRKLEIIGMDRTVSTLTVSCIENALVRVKYLKEKLSSIIISSSHTKVLT